MNTTPLRSEEQLTPEDWRIIAIASVNQSLEEDRDQAYTSLVEGIKKEEVEEGEALYSDDPDRKMSQGYTDGYNQALADIIENVVKPLYGKK